MLTKRFVNSLNLLYRPHTNYCSKRYVRRQLLSEIFPSCNVDHTLSSALATGSVSQKARLLFFNLYIMHM